MAPASLVVVVGCLSVLLAGVRICGPLFNASTLDLLFIVLEFILFFQLFTIVHDLVKC